MTDPNDELLDLLRAADPIDPEQLPSATSPQAQYLLAQAMTGGPATAEPSTAGAPVANTATAAADGRIFVTPPRINNKPSSTAARHRGRGLVAAAAAVILVFAGLLVFSPNSTSPALAAVQNAAAETAGFSSGRSTTTFSINDAQGQTSTTGSASGTLAGAFSGTSVSLAVNASASGESLVGDQAGSVETRLVDNKVYVKNGDRWLVTDADGLFAPAIVAYLDPRSVLTTVRKLTTTNEIGPATIDGLAVTHYQSVVDLSQQSLDSWIPGLGLAKEPVEAEGEATIDVYVDSDGVLRHLDVNGEARDPNGTGSAKFTLTTVFSDLGGDIAIDAPANAEVITSDNITSLGD